MPIAKKVGLYECKKIIIVSIIVLFYTFCFSQDYWESIYSSEETIFSMVVDSNDNIFLNYSDISILKE